MARAEMALSRARRGDLPPVCVVTGQSAAGYCPLSVDRGWGRSTTVRLPMTAEVFERWHARSLLRLRAGLGAGFCVLGAAVSARFPTVALVFAVCALGLGGAWMAATWTLSSLVPPAHIDGDRLILTSAHRDFAAALR